MKFAIRDDDTNYFTKPEDLIKIYKNIWDIVPISIAVVPFVHTTITCVPPEYKHMDSHFPIDRNRNLVEFIKKQINDGKVSIMLHGYGHQVYENGYEYDLKDYNTLYKKTKEGKEYLEKTFGIKIKSFVPPNHALSKEGMKAIVANGLNIVGTASLHKRFTFNQKYIINLTKVLSFRLRHGKRPVRYPYILDFGDHKEVYCYVITPKTTFEELKEGLYFAHEKNGVFCVTGHISSMPNDRKTIKIMEDIVKESKRLPDVEYVTVDQLFD
jgi:hypothetical protein